MRLYFDSNIIFLMRKGSLGSLLEDLRNYNNLWVGFYSQNSVNEIIKGDAISVEKDLALLSELTNDNLLSLSSDYNSVVVKSVSPQKIAELTDNHQEDLPKSKDVLRLFEEYLPEDEFERYKSHHNEYFPSDFDEFVDKVQKSMNVKGEYGKVKKEMFKNYRLTNRHQSWTKNIIQKVSKELVDSIGKSFEELLEENQRATVTKYKETQFSKYISAFCILDTIGFEVEKTKGTFKNYSEDASHSFYGSFCDYIITNDSRLKRKSQALYEYYGIDCKVFSPEQLQKEFPSIISTHEKLFTSDFKRTGDSNNVKYFMSYFDKINYLGDEIIEFSNSKRSFGSLLSYYEVATILRNLFDGFSIDNSQIESAYHYLLSPDGNAINFEFGEWYCELVFYKEQCKFKFMMRKQS